MTPGIASYELVAVDTGPRPDVLVRQVRRRQAAADRRAVNVTDTAACAAPALQRAADAVHAVHGGLLCAAKAEAEAAAVAVAEAAKAVLLAGRRLPDAVAERERRFAAAATGIAGRSCFAAVRLPAAAGGLEIVRCAAAAGAIVRRCDAAAAAGQ